MATYARAILASAAIVAVSCAPKAERGVAKESFEDDEWRTRFHDWTVQYGKVYESVEEWESRFVTFVSNAEYVREYNAVHSSHWLGLNSLADLSQDEFRSKYLGLDPLMGGGLENRADTPFKYENVEISKVPTSIDWRKKGAVTHVKNQGICGSCWSFSTTGSVEGINAIYSGDLVVLSEQELIDCDTTRDHGCQGGLMDFAFKFILQNGGIATEADYPYTMNQGPCRNIRTSVTIDGYEDVPANNEVALMKAVAHQPVSVAVQANTRAFQLYSGGVFDSPDCGTALDHGVLVVGYGESTPSTDSNKKEDYWIVKNSWGAMWGEEGYIRIARNVDAAEGMCGIAMMPSYPTKDEPNPPPGPPPSPTPSPSPGPSPAPGPTPVPPGPGPVQCSNGQQCPPGGTCCCLFQFSGTCLIYGCCPYPDAVCCDDHVHCCPKDHPVCDTQGGGCKASNAANAVSVPLGVKSPAKNTFSRSNPLLLQGKPIEDQG